MKSHNQIINSDLFLKSASQYIGSGYTRKAVLRELVYNTYGNSSIENATMLNIYIDLNSILHGLYSEHNRILIDNITDISSAIINMCAHYRSFFRDNLSVDTRIFLINSKNICDINKKFVSGYNKTFDMKCNVTETSKIIERNMKLLEILCPYLPAIYYIDSTQQFETAVIIAYLIEYLNDNNPNLIISHDMYPLQLCTQYKWTSYLYPSKGRINGELVDRSWMIPVNDKDNFKDCFWDNYIRHRNYNSNILKAISPINYSLLISMITFKERELKSLLNTATAIKFIQSIVGSEDIRIESSMFLNNPNLQSFPLAQIDSRYKAMDVQFMLPIYRNSPESKNIKLLDLNDIATVNNISAKYYQNNPLDLIHL